MALESEYRIAVLLSYQELQDALLFLQERIVIQDARLPAWFEPPQDLSYPPAEPVRKQVFSLLSQLEYLDHQKPREILIGAGLLAASLQTYTAIEHLNLCKDRFKAAMLALKAAKIKVSDPYLTEHFESKFVSRSTVTAKTLRRVGLARLHLKQCYRRIPLFKERPHKVSWTWANTRAITRISVKTAEQLLLKQGKDPGIQLQLQKLYALPIDEPLAIVQELAPHLRANIVLPGEAQTVKRQMVKGPVPLFYLGDEKEPLPQIRPPKTKQSRDAKRPVRSDVKLNREPFLPAIHVHRYL